MSPDGAPRSRRFSRLRLPHVVTLSILVICTLVEGTLVLADQGVIDWPRLRFLAYTYGGFWPGLLDNWRPNYPGQTALMFFTYAFLHGGWLHFIVNMITLVSLGQAVAERGGTFRYIAIYFASILGGAAVFGLFAADLRPMVGASGALFGLVGAITAWDAAIRRERHLTFVPILKIVVFLVAMNVVLWWAMSGQLAWQTHLGGFLAGALAAALLGERPDPPEPA